MKLRLPIDEDEDAAAAAAVAADLCRMNNLQQMCLELLALATQNY